MILPGMEVWNKIYGKSMIVSYIGRNIYSKELDYGSVYMAGDKEEYATSRAKALVPLENKLKVPMEEKRGAVFEDGRDSIAVRNSVALGFM